MNPYNINISAYTPRYDPNSQIGQLIGKIGGYLKPQQSFSSVLPYDDFAKPQREAFNLWERQSFRPEFERFTLNPYKNQYANMAAASNAQMLGGGAKQYKTALRQTEQPYYNQLEQARGSWEDMMRNDYQRRMQKYYDNPTANLNY